MKFEGMLNGNGMRVGIVVARFNEMITKQLLEGALDGLRRHGVDEQSIDIAWVPGSFELPVTAKRMAASDQYDAVITLGAIIRGSTSHYDHVAAQTAAGISQASTDTGVPVIFGVLTTETIEQAIERSGTKLGNKGFDAAVAAIEMVDVLRQLPKPL